MRKIAIVGAGFFGCALAERLSKKYIITLYEKKGDIMQNASRFNQFRYHLGFHYPRSGETINEVCESDKFNKKFKFFYQFSSKTKNFYGISKTNSRLNLKKYLKIINKFNIKYKIYSKPSFVKNVDSEKLIETNEFNLNYLKYKKFLKKNIKKNKNIELKFNTEFNKNYIKDYEYIFICTYHNNNLILKDCNIKKLTKKKYELIEKIIVQVPKKFRNLSLVILDGPFFNIDPYLGTKYHLLSSVKFSKLEVCKGLFPKFKSKFKNFYNKEIYNDIKLSQFNKVIKQTKSFIDFSNNIKYIGSFFTIRTIQGKNKGDSRTSVVTRHNQKIFSILSGKWNTSYYIAEKVYKLINDEEKSRNSRKR